MSHRWDCPDRWEAERQGERAFEWGRSRLSNPHESLWPDEGCEDAADAWRSGYRRAEIREEERREEDAARYRAEMRRAEMQAEEDNDYQQQESYPQESYPPEDES